MKHLNFEVAAKRRQKMQNLKSKQFFFEKENCSLSEVDEFPKEIFDQKVSIGNSSSWHEKI